MALVNVKSGDLILASTTNGQNTEIKSNTSRITRLEQNTVTHADVQTAISNERTSIDTSINNLREETENLIADISTNFDEIESSAVYGVHPEHWGAVGDGVNDDTNAMLEAVQYAWQHKQPLVLSGGKVYTTTRDLHINDRINILGNNATIRATADITHILFYSDDDANQFPETKTNGRIADLILDGNGHANYCLLIFMAKGITVENVDVCGFKITGIYDDKGFEHFYHNVRIAGSGAIGETGLVVKNTADSRFANITTKNCETGVKNDGGENRFTMIHAWYAGVPCIPTSVMFSTSRNAFCDQCYADTVAVGFDITANVELVLNQCSFLHGGNAWTSYSTANPIAIRIPDASYAEKIHSTGMHYESPDLPYDLFNIDVGDHADKTIWDQHNAPSIRVMGNYPGSSYLEEFKDRIRNSATYNTSVNLFDAQNRNGRKYIKNRTVGSAIGLAMSSVSAVYSKSVHVEENVEYTLSFLIDKAPESSETGSRRIVICDDNDIVLTSPITYPNADTKVTFTAGATGWIWFEVPTEAHSIMVVEGAEAPKEYIASDSTIYGMTIGHQIAAVPPVYAGFPSMTVRSVAHRGNPIDAPQGTGPAYISARKRGFRYAENDVTATKDGVFVMWHDDSLYRLGDLYTIEGYEVYKDPDDWVWLFKDTINDKVYSYGTGTQVMNVSYDDVVNDGYTCIFEGDNYYYFVSPEGEFARFDLATNDLITYTYIEEASSDTSGLTRVNGTGLSITDCEYTNLFKIDFGRWKHRRFRGTQILTFRQWVSLCKVLGMEIYIDFKTDYTRTNVLALYDTVKKLGMKDKATWIINSSTANKLRTADPNVKLLVLSRPTAENRAAWASYIGTVGSIGFDCPASSLVESEVQAALAEGFEVESYYADYGNLSNYEDTGNISKEAVLAKIRQMVSMGVTGISADKFSAEEAFFELWKGV